MRKKRLHEMNNDLLKKMIFPVVSIFQIVVIGVVITGALVILNGNHEIRLKCRLYDPYDFMKGRYIHLTFDIDGINIKDMTSLNGFDYDKIYEMKNMPLYCILGTEDGYSVIKDASFKKPASGETFIKMKIRNISTDKIYFKIYFDQYYLQESYASEAENLLRNSHDENEVAPVLILAAGNDGNVVQKRFEIKGMPIEKYIKDNVKL
jgi:uncharacterized membrane-anchored protein